MRSENSATETHLLSVAGRKGRQREPQPKIKRWISVRRALETYAVRIGRGSGHGSPVLWKLKEGDAVYAAVIRKRKAAAYARRKRKRERLEKR